MVCFTESKPGEDASIEYVPGRRLEKRVSPSDSDFVPARSEPWLRWTRRSAAPLKGDSSCNRRQIFRLAVPTAGEGAEPWILADSCGVAAAPTGSRTSVEKPRIRTKKGRCIPQPPTLQYPKSSAFEADFASKLEH